MEGRRGVASGPPVDVGPSRWALPDARPGDPDGVVGVGADLEPATLVDAYRRGIFPWPHGADLPWFSPDPRMVVHPRGMHVSRSLRRTLRRSGWTTTLDRAFDAVMVACSEARDDGTWITQQMRRAYGRLEGLGWAHSVEVWDDERLVGGVYGVQVGGVFTGESMFHREDDASKVALLDLCGRLADAGGVLLDAQLPTAHLATLGFEQWPRSRFLALLAQQRDSSVLLPADARSVGDLVV